MTEPGIQRIEAAARKPDRRFVWKPLDAELPEGHRAPVLVIRRHRAVEDGWSAWGRPEVVSAGNLRDIRTYGNQLVEHRWFDPAEISHDE